MDAILSFVQNNDEPSSEDRLREWKDNSNLSMKSLQALLYVDSQNTKDVHIPEHVFGDLGIMEAVDGPSLYETMDRSKTSFGSCMFRRLLEMPTSNVKIIETRQNVIKTLQKDKHLKEALVKIIGELKGLEKDFIWFWTEETESSNIMMDVVYFNFPLVGKLLNKNEYILGANSIYRTFITPAMCLLTPLMAFIFPYIMMRKMGLNVSFFQVFHLLKRMVLTSSLVPATTKWMTIASTAVWFLFFAQNVYYTIKHAHLAHKIVGVLHQKVNALAKVVKATQQLQYILNTKEGKPFLPYIEFPEFESQVYPLLSNSCFFSPYTLFSNKGRILATYKKIHDVLPVLLKCARSIGMVDSFLSLSDYIDELKEHSLPWTYVQYNKKEKMKDFWNPLLLHTTNRSHPVVNSLPLKKNTHVALLTGPNAAGKSTFTRTVMINHLLSQTLGIAMAKKWKTKTPYYFFDTYLNVPDSEGHASLFEAEMYRCMECLKTVEQNKDKPALLIMDEVFSSTNFREGFSAAYAVVDHLANHFPNLLCLVTTHFHGLTELEKKSKKKILNFCLDIGRDEKGKIIYPFKARRGVCKEHIALELLRNNGFSHSLLDTADRVYKTLQEPTIPKEYHT